MANWLPLYDCENVNDALDIFHSLVLQNIDIFVPKVLPSKASYRSWFSKELRSLIREKNKSYKKN